MGDWTNTLDQVSLTKSKQCEMLNLPNLPDSEDAKNPEVTHSEHDFKYQRQNQSSPELPSGLESKRSFKRASS